MRQHSTVNSNPKDEKLYTSLLFASFLAEVKTREYLASNFTHTSSCITKSKNSVAKKAVRPLNKSPCQLPWALVAQGQKKRIQQPL